MKAPIKLLVAVTMALSSQVAPDTIRAQDVVRGETEFVLSAGDRIRVSVWPDSSLSGEFPLEASGIVHLPLLGDINAAGKTSERLRDELRAAYEGERRRTVVTVTPLFRVSVLGEVREPGIYWVEPGYGVFEMLSLAGGLRPAADEDDITVIRPGEPPYRVDAARLLDPSSSEASLLLRSGDRLLVPASRGVDWRVVLSGLTLSVALVNLFVN